MVVTDYLPANTAVVVPTVPPAGSGGGLFSVGYSGPLPRDRIVVDPGNERGELTGLDDLAATIAAEGQLEPLVVYPVGDGSFMISSGHRRHAALDLLNRPTAWVVIVAPPPDAGARILRRLTANLQRADLTPIEEAHAYQALVAQGVKQTEIGRRVGKDQSTIANTLRLLTLPEPVQTLLAARKLTTRHGLELLAAEPEISWRDGSEVRSVAEVQIAYAQTAADNGATAATIHVQVQSLKSNNAYYRKNAAQQQKAQDRQAVREGTASAEQLQAAADRVAAENARLAKEKAAREREQARLAQRATVANTTIDAILGMTPDTPPTLAALRLAASVTLIGAHVPYQDRTLWLARIEAAPDAPTLVGLIATLGRMALALGPEERSLGDNLMWEYRNWLERQYHFDQAIADALFTAGLLTARSHQALVAEATRRGGAPPAASTPGPTQGHEQAAQLVAAGRTEYTGTCDVCGGPVTLDGDAEWCPVCDAPDPAPPVACASCGGPTYRRDALTRCRRCDDGGVADAPPLASYLGHTCLRCNTKLDDFLPTAGWAWMPNGVSYHVSGVVLTPQGAVYCADCGPGVAVCHRCGCTDEAGCDEGCSWITPTLCSACAPAEAAA